MSLTEKLANDLAEIETLAEQAENDIKNGADEKAEERVQEIRDLCSAWQ